MGSGVGMAERAGTVERATGDQCWVRLDPGGCPGCRCQFASRATLHVLEVPPSAPVLMPGSRVRLQLATGRLREVARVTFGPPLGGLVLGAGLAEAWIEGAGPIGGGLGLVVGLLVSWLAAKRLELKGRCRPELVLW